MPDDFTPPVTPPLGITVLRQPPPHPYLKANFRVFIADREIAIHSISPLRLGSAESADGETPETDVIEYREGSSPEASAMKIPGLRRFGDVTLRRGIFSGDNEVFEWFASNQTGAAEARSVTISLLDDDRDPVMVWKLEKAWIRKITGPILDAQGSSVAIEEMILTCEDISVEND